MFGRKKLEREIESLRDELRATHNDYWKLRHELWTLLNHLEVKIVDEPAKQIVVPIRPKLD